MRHIQILTLLSSASVITSAPFPSLPLLRCRNYLCVTAPSLHFQSRCKGTTARLRFTNHPPIFFQKKSPRHYQLPPSPNSLGSTSPSASHIPPTPRMVTVNSQLSRSKLFVALLQCCSSREAFPIPKNTSIFIYKYRVNF